jgi:hypothetical protein
MPRRQRRISFYFTNPTFLRLFRRKPRGLRHVLANARTSGPAAKQMGKMPMPYSVLMMLFVVLLEQIISEIVGQISPHAVNVVGVVLRVVVLD